MTATHYCVKCRCNTTHQVLSGAPGTMYEDMTVLRCVVCGTTWPLTITEIPDKQRGKKMTETTYEGRLLRHAGTSGDACKSELHDDACKMATELLKLRASATTEADWLRAARNTIRFFASVIKSGEDWTEQCEDSLRRGLGRGDYHQHRCKEMEKKGGN